MINESHIPDSQDISEDSPSVRSDTDNQGESEAQAGSGVVEDADVLVVAPGKIVHFAETSLKSLRTKVCIGGHIIDALIDTGASKSLMSQALALELGLVPCASELNFKEIGNKEVKVIFRTLFHCMIFSTN